MAKDKLRPLVAFLIPAVVLWVPVMRGPIDLRWDAGVCILATSLTKGSCYRILSDPENPQAVQYPPILPLLVAGQERMLGTSETFKLMLAAATYLLARRWFFPWQDADRRGSK